MSAATTWLGPLAHVLRVNAQVERGHVQSEDLYPRAEVGECAVGDTSGAVRAERGIDAGQVVRELVGVSVLVGGEPLPDSNELGAVRLVARRIQLRDRPDELRGHSPRGAEQPHVAPQEVAGERPRALERVDDRVRAGVRVSVHVAADPGAEPKRRRRSRDRLAQLAHEPRQRLPQARLDEPQPVADLVDDARPPRAHLVRLPEDRHLLRDLLANAPLGRVRQLRIVEPAQRRREALVRLEDRAAARLGRMRGEHRPHLEPRCRREELVVADTRVAQSCDRIGERLARHAALVLVLAAAAQAMVLLGDVRELEEDREGPQHGGLLVEREGADGLLELRALARFARVTCEPADLFLQHEQLFAFLLDEDVSQHVAEQADVGSELRVWCAHSRATLLSPVKLSSAPIAVLVATISLASGGSSSATDYGRTARAGCAAANGTAAVAAPRFVRTIATGETGWFASPGLVDLNGDGRLEIVAPFYSTFVFDAKGRPLGKGTATKGRVYAPGVVADLDGDKVSEIVVGGNEGTVAAYELRGGSLKLEPGWPASTCSGGQCPEARGMAAADLDGDGRIEVVVTTTNTSPTGSQVFVFNAKGSVYRPKGAPATAWPRFNKLSGKGNDADFNGYGNHGYGAYGENVGIGNLDDDPQLEIVVTFDNHQINVFNHDGTSVLTSPWFRNRDSRHSGRRLGWGQFIRWLSPVVEDRHYHQHVGPWPHPKTDMWLQWTASPPSVADLDRDGRNEVIGLPNAEMKEPYETQAYAFMVLDGAQKGGARSGRRHAGFVTLPLSRQAGRATQRRLVSAERHPGSHRGRHRRRSAARDRRLGARRVRLRGRADREAAVALRLRPRSGEDVCLGGRRRRPQP